MDVQPIIDRLRECLADLPLREIEAGVEGVNAALQGSRAAPALYVVPVAERGVYMPHTGCVEQHETRVFAVLMVLEAVDSIRGQGISLQLLRQRIKQALIGWVPDAETGEPVLFDGGAMVDFSGAGVLAWGDDYVMTGYFRSEE